MALAGDVPEDAVYAILTGDSDVSGLVGTRIYQHVAPQGTVQPLITFSRIGAQHESHMGGATGLANARIQVTSWDDTPEDAMTLAEHVRDALVPFKGSSGGAEISAVFLDGDSTDFEQLTAGRENFVYNVSQEYTFWFGESIPA